MSTANPSVLIVDDEPDIRNLIGDILTDEGYKIEVAHDASAARTAVRIAQFDAILLDIWMPGDDGVTLLKEWRDKGMDVPVIMMSGHGTVETAVEATRHGAYDFIEKPVSTGRLLVTIRNAVGSQQPSVEVGQKDAGRTRFIGSSAATESIRRKIREIGAAPESVMIVGETGVGRRTIAQLIHEQFGGTESNFVTLDISICESIESVIHDLRDLDADSSIMFPNVHLYDGWSQIRTLGVLQCLREKTSGKKDAPAPRILSTASANIESLVNRSVFRSDLYFQLRSYSIDMPPLRKRPEDIPELVGYFTDHLSQYEGLPYKRIATSALNRLRHHQWAGNVTELKNVLRQAIVYGTGEMIQATDIEHYLIELEVDEDDTPLPPSSMNLGFDLPIRSAREQFEREYLLYNLRMSKSYVEVAERTGMHRTSLFRKLKEHGIEIAPGEESEKSS